VTSSLKIGTRSSALALWQARFVLDAFRNSFPDRHAEIVKVKTTGDRVLDRPLFKIGGKGLFTKELEDRLLDRSVDMAVHSLKDLPTELPPGLAIGAVLPRGSQGDAAVLPSGKSFEALEEGARVGTGSLRRRAQLKARRPDLVMADLRGNLDTRLGKLAAEEMDALVVAKAGLERLGVDRARFTVEDLDLVPAPGQGAVAVEVLAARDDLRPLLEVLDHDETRRCVEAERGFLAALGGGCHIPIGARATIDSQDPQRLRLVGLVGAVDGSALVRREAVSGIDPHDFGRTLAHEALEAGARHILENLSGEAS